MIVPDLHTMNFSAGKQRINDRGSNREAAAICEVKLCTARKSRYMHVNTNTMPVDRRTRIIDNSYSRKVKTLDVTFAANVVGDRNGGIKGPFKTVQQIFL